MATIAVENLGKSFIREGGQTLPVLERLTFEAGENEFCCLLGTSGCGKSTVLNILAGLIPADCGEIHIEGQAGSGEQVRIGYVFQTGRLLNWKSARDNIIFGLKGMGIPQQQWQTRVEHYLTLVGLQEFADAYPPALSGGMQQRLAIARALAVDPEILLMDEPFSHLDELTARGLRQQLLKIWDEEKKTIIFVTHNALEAVYLADTVHLFTHRPARVLRSIAIGVPRPREMEDPELISIQRGIIRELGLQ